MRDSLSDCWDYLTDWRDYILRVRDLAYNQNTSIASDPPRARVRSSAPEVSTGSVVTGILIKTAQLLTPVNVYTESLAWKAYFDLFVESWLSPFEKALIDKFLLGLSFLVLERVGKEVRLNAVDPYDVAWVPTYRLDQSPKYYRRIRASWEQLHRMYPEKHLKKTERSEVYVEYAADTLRVLTAEGRELSSEPNPCEPYLPIFPLVYIYPVGVDVPIGDWEMGYTQQRLLDEVRRALLSYSRRGGGWILVSAKGLSLGELEKLRNAQAQEPVIVFETTVPEALPVMTPPPPAELLQLKDMVQADINSRLGVSDYERLTLPTEKVSYATEAQLIAQSSARRARKDLLELRLLMSQILRAYSQYTLFLKRGGKTFLGSDGTEYTLPSEPPVTIRVRDVSETIQEQVKAQFLTETFGNQLKVLPVNTAELLKLIGSYTGITEEEMRKLVENPTPMVGTPPGAPPAPPGILPVPPATPIGEPIGG